jgi:adenylylsulfate kinase-like enzyme
MTGISSPYEAPKNPDLVVNGTVGDYAETVRLLTLGL